MFGSFKSECTVALMLSSNIFEYCGCNPTVPYILEDKFKRLPVVFHCRDMNNLLFSEATWLLPREYPIHL
jgi:hypothetical protein